jgi:hypothetical protein
MNRERGGALPAEGFAHAVNFAQWYLDPWRKGIGAARTVRLAGFESDRRGSMLPYSIDNGMLLLRRGHITLPKRRICW